jgi:hypothetical protein
MAQDAALLATQHWSAMIYEHATRDRDEATARALGGLLHQVRSDCIDQAGGDLRAVGVWPICGPPALIRVRT